MLMFGRVSSLQIYYSTAILLGMFLQLINVLILIFDQSQNFVGKTKQLTSSTFSLTSSLYSLLVCCHPALLDHHPSLWKQLIAHFDVHRLVFGINSWLISPDTFISDVLCMCHFHSHDPCHPLGLILHSFTPRLNQISFPPQTASWGWRLQWTFSDLWCSSVLAERYYVTFGL